MKDTFTYTLGQIFFLFIFKLFFNFKVTGIENVPKKGPVIIAANHTSFLDPTLVGSAIWSRQICFLARATLFHNRFLGWLLRQWHAIPLKRESADISALKIFFDVLEKGAAILIFPEGTRSNDGELQKAKRGIGFLSLKTQVPIVPVYIDGAFKSFPRGAKGIRFNKITVYFGKPIHLSYPDSVINREKYQQASNDIMKEIRQLKTKYCIQD